MNFSFTNENTDHIYSCRQYSLQFPDEFQILPQAKQEFCACLENPEDPGKPFIVIKAGRTNPIQTFGMEIHSQSLLQAVLRLNALKGQGGLLWIAERSKNFTIQTESDEFACYYDIKNRTATYYVYMVFYNATKPVIITIQGLDEEDADRGQKIVTSLVQHLKVKQMPFTPLESLFAPQFTGGLVTGLTLGSWKKLLDLYLEELEHLFLIELQITQQQNRGEQKKGSFTQEKADQEYEKNIKAHAWNLQQLFEQTTDFLKLIYDKNRDNPAFYELVEQMEALILEHQSAKVSIDHEERAVAVENAPVTWAKWHYCLLLRNKAELRRHMEALLVTDGELLREYQETEKQYEELYCHLCELEADLSEGREANRRKIDKNVQLLTRAIEQKEVELGSYYAQQNSLKQQINQLGFFQRLQKEQMNRQLSAVVIRIEGIRTEISKLEREREQEECLINDGLEATCDAINSYRLRLRLKQDELQKSQKMLERSRAQIESRKEEEKVLNDDFLQVRKLLENKQTDSN